MTTVPVGATMSTVPVGSAAKYDEPDTNQLLHGSGSGSSASGTRSRNGAPIGTGKVREEEEDWVVHSALRH